MPDIDSGTKYYSITNKLEWRCKYCSKRYTLNGGTRLIKVHIKRLRGSRCTGWWAWKLLQKMLSIDWSEEGRRPHSVG
jgi:hypothetical protein